MPDRRKRGWGLIVAGALTALLVAVLGYLDTKSPAPDYSLALLVVLALLAVGLLAAGFALLRMASEVASGSAPPPEDYRHTYRLFGLLGLGFVAALGARSLAVPENFGKDGFYRTEAPLEAMVARAPKFQGSASCTECHEWQVELHAKDVHRNVQCENCHGPAAEHLAAEKKRGTIAKTPQGDWCLTCHRQLTARPGSFPQVSWEEHFRYVGADPKQTKCTDCHDAHEPLFLETPVSEARLHPLIHRCRDCHLGRVDEKQERPEDHPAIFECQYCHKEIARHYATTPHRDVECTNCHLFQRETEFSGRIVRNKDPRFCFLCHGEKEFRPLDARPENGAKIIPLNHATAYDKKADEETPCTQCHAAQVHGQLKEKR